MLTNHLQRVLRWGHLCNGNLGCRVGSRRQGVCDLWAHLATLRQWELYAERSTAGVGVVPNAVEIGVAANMGLRGLA